MSTAQTDTARCAACDTPTRILVFGAGSGAMELPDVARFKGWDIAAYVDNDAAKHGMLFQERPVIGPEAMADTAHDLVVIASAYHDEIRAQLLDMGVPADRILRYPDPSYDWGKPVIPCHFSTLQITHTGKVYPCCKIGPWDGVYDHADKVIGHIGDAELGDKLRAFGANCECATARLRRARDDEKPEYNRLFIELSLKCQAQCAMCFADAPNYTGTYDLYEDLGQVIELTRPREMVFQGGEVLVQKRSLEWLGRMREAWPDIRFALITNGCVPVSMADTVERLFDRISVSIVGFQPRTYRTVMGLDLERTKAHMERLLQAKKVEVFLKYLITPVNVHELPLFLDWAIPLGPPQIRVISTANFATYINKNTFDDYWNKILSRTREQTEKTLKLGRAAMEANGTRLFISPESGNLLGMGRPEYLASVLMGAEG